MTDTSRRINKRALDALNLVAAGGVREADGIYAELLAEAEGSAPNEVPEICGQWADVKVTLGAVDDALALYERAIREALRLSNGGESLRVAVYRHFQGEFLVRQNRASEALAVVEPGLRISDAQDRFLFITYARALWQSGRYDAARDAAERAVALAGTDVQKTKAMDLLADIFAGRDSAG